MIRTPSGTIHVPDDLIVNSQVSVEPVTNVKPLGHMAVMGTADAGGIGAVIMGIRRTTPTRAIARVCLVFGRADAVFRVRHTALLGSTWGKRASSGSRIDDVGGLGPHS